MHVPLSINELLPPQSVEFAYPKLAIVPVQIMSQLGFRRNIGHDSSKDRVVCECGIIDSNDVGQIIRRCW